ncbi:hypothetical protein GCM10009808_20230 [Microbacterium sediminicola]|uniref:ABC-2 type transport system permease protein n=1 Tax=Microbacterium sediminicola TaxID=415210 RepID=A0ABP4UB75_9MICO
MNAAVWAEAMKLRRSTVGLVASAAIVGGILAICGGMLVAAGSGSDVVAAKLGPYADASWWGLLGTCAQVTGAAAFVGFGVVLSWMFGREFAEGTITGLFGLPVTLTHTAMAKVTVYLAWAGLVAVALTAGEVVLGLALGLGAPDEAAWLGVARQFALVLLTAVIALPVAWVTTLTRSLLAGVGTVIGLVAVAQIVVIGGAGGWVPLAAPTLWALEMDVTPAQLLLSVVWGALGILATLIAWKRLQLDR